MALIEEVVIPGHRFDQSIHVEGFQRVITGDDGVTGPGSHIGIVIFELVFFEDFFVDEEISHGSVFNLNEKGTSFLTKS